MNMYPNQLQSLSIYAKALDAADKEVESLGEVTVMLADPIAVVDSQDPNSLVGYLVDELGGFWSFREATAEERQAFNEAHTKKAGS